MRKVHVHVKLRSVGTNQTQRMRVLIKRKDCAFTSGARSVSVHIERTKCEYTLYVQMQVHSKSKHAKLHVHMTRTKCTQCTKGVRAYQAHEVCTYTTVARSVRERSKRTTCVCTSSASGVCTSGAQSSRGEQTQEAHLRINQAKYARSHRVHNVCVHIKHMKFTCTSSARSS